MLHGVTTYTVDEGGGEPRLYLALSPLWGDGARGSRPEGGRNLTVLQWRPKPTFHLTRWRGGWGWV